MEFLNLSDTAVTTLPPGVTSINDLKQTRVSRTLSKAVSLHLEGKLEAAALHQTGRHAEAVEHYRRVLARNPKSEEALSNLVAMFLEKKDPQSVRRYAEMLVELQPDSAVAQEALATTAFAEGDYLTAAR